MISPAELPINKRGAVYHLDLCRDELADIVITVGDPGRVAQVSRYFDKVEVVRIHREFITHTGWLGNKRISVVSTGIGMPNIDIVMNELDALKNIDLQSRTPLAHPQSLTIIRLGTTGGLQGDCIPGDIMVSAYAVGFDTLLDYYAYTLDPELEALHDAMSHHLAHEASSFYVSQADTALVKYFSQLGKSGITATCGGFYGPQGRHLRIGLRYPHLLDKLTSFKHDGVSVINFEMETAAILGLGTLLGHHCLSLSVALANRQTGEFVADINVGVENLIKKALELIVQR